MMAIGARAYYGVHSARLNSVLFTGSEVLCTLGGYLVAYDPVTLAKVAERYLFEDMILCLLQLPQSQSHVIATSYSGSFVLATTKGEVVHSCKASQPIVAHAEVSAGGDLLATCGEFGNYYGVIDVWTVSLETGFSHVFQVSGNYSTCDFTVNGNLFALRMSPVHIKGQSPLLKNRPIPIEKATEDFPQQAEPSLEELAADLEMHEVKECTFYACRYELSGERSRRAVPVDVTAGLITARSRPSRDLFIGSFQGRVLVCFRMETLEKLFTVQVQGSSVLQSLYFLDDRSVLFVPHSGVLSILDVESREVPAVIDGKSQAVDCVKVIHTRKDWVNSDDCYVGWDRATSRLLVFDDYCIYTGTIDLLTGSELTDEQSVVRLQLSACGVSLSPDCAFAAVGDLSGQLQVLALREERLCDVATHSTVITRKGVSARSVLWSASADMVFVGTLGGSVFTLLNPRSEEGFLLPAMECADAVTALREKCLDGRLLLAIGTVGGEVVIADASATGELTRLQSFLAHCPQEGFDSASYFGSLKHFSEVWSIAWSPVAEEWQLATSSEDQTVVVWSLLDQQRLATLPKHKRAVTGVSWKVVAGAERLISCSDDRSVRVYEARSWQLLFTFWTVFIREWHTLTYAEIDEARNQVVAVSQNGYIFVLAMDTFTVKYAKKVHYGSVEGLSLRGGKVATCSSECSVCVLNLL